MAEHTIVTTVQVERTYKVQADTEKQARSRVRAYIDDRDQVAPKIVVLQKSEDGAERIKAKQGDDAPPAPKEEPLPDKPSNPDDDVQED